MVSIQETYYEMEPVLSPYISHLICPWKCWKDQRNWSDWDAQPRRQDAKQERWKTECFIGWPL